MEKNKYEFIMPSNDHIRMKILIKDPEWVKISYVPKMVDKNWDYEDLESFIIQKGIATKTQLNYGEEIHHKIRPRSMYQITDYDLDELELSIPFINHLKELHQFEEAQLFYHEQWLDYQMEEDEKAIS
jgi:hypothetical protein